MKKIFGLTILVLLALTAARAELVFYFDFDAEQESSAAGIPEVSKRPFTLRLLENTESRRRPLQRRDAPDSYASRSRRSVLVNRGLIWLRGDRSDSIILRRDFSFNFWVKLEEEPIDSVWFFSARGSFQFGYSPGGGGTFLLNKEKTGQKLVSDPIHLPLNEWAMITLTSDNDVISCFLDGRKVSGIRLNGGLADVQEIIIGNTSASGRNFFPGKFDDFSFWNHALTSAELEALYSGLSPLSIISATPKLKRIVTTGLPADFRPYEPRRTLSLVRDGRPEAVIVRSDRGGAPGVLPRLQQFLREQYRCEFPVLDAPDALKSGKTLLLFGQANENMPLRRLVASRQIPPRPAGSELYIFPGALDWPAGAVFLGGDSDQAVMRSAQRLVERFPDPSALPFAIDRESCRDAVAPADYEVEQVGIMQRYFQGIEGDSGGRRLPALKQFVPVFRRFRQTGDAVYARTFAALLKTYWDNTQESRSDGTTAREFSFHEFIMMLDLIEQSPAFTAEDRTLAAKLARRAGENSMSYRQMLVPLQSYQGGPQFYHSSHTIYAMMGVYFGADYLLRRYSYEPARYWQAVAINAMDGIAPHPVSPADAAPLQHVSYQLFLEYAVASGRYNLAYFQTETFRNYIRYIKAQIHHLGFTPGYGDSLPLYQAPGVTTLAYALGFADDPEAASLLSLVRRNTPDQALRDDLASLGIPLDLPVVDTPELTGLASFPLDRFRLEHRQIRYTGKDYLDKAFFRSGRHENADFLALSGVSEAPRGHYDANGILLYAAGPHYFLIEGDPIRKYPEDHNTLNLTYEGKTVLPGRSEPGSLAILKASARTPNRRMALTRSTVEKYGPGNWTRTIAYEADLGFWCLDEFDVKLPGAIRLECRWRLLGEVIEQAEQRITVRQRPAERDGDRHLLSITEGSGVRRKLETRLDAGEGGRNGYYAAYPYAGPETRIVTQYHAGDFKQGNKLVFLNYIQPHRPGDDTRPEIRRLSQCAYVAVSPDTVRLALFGDYRGHRIDFIGESCFLGPAGLIGVNVHKLVIGDWTLADGEASSIELDREAIPPKVAEILRRAAAASPALPSALPVAQEARDYPARSIPLPGRPTALTSGRIRFAVGLEDGRFLLYDNDGTHEFTFQLSGKVTATSSIPAPEKRRYWLAAAEAPPDDPGAAMLYAFDGTGREVWKRRIPPAAPGRNAVIRTLFPAKYVLFGGTAAIVTGDETGYYRVFDFDGNPLWEHDLGAGATVGAAADLDGSGLDQIFAGTESTGQLLLDTEGKVILRQEGAPRATAVRAVNLDREGGHELLFGRSDDAVHLMSTSQRKKTRQDAMPAGGRIVGITDFESLDAVFAVATANGRIVFGNERVQRVRDLVFDCGFYGLLRQDKSLLLFADNGFVYRLNRLRQLTARYRIGCEPLQPPPLPPVIAGETAGIIIGNTLYLVGPSRKTTEENMTLE